MSSVATIISYNVHLPALTHQPVFQIHASPNYAFKEDFSTHRVRNFDFQAQVCSKNKVRGLFQVSARGREARKPSLGMQSQGLCDPRSEVHKVYLTKALQRLGSLLLCGEVILAQKLIKAPRDILLGLVLIFPDLLQAFISIKSLPLKEQEGRQGGSTDVMPVLWYIKGSRKAQETRFGPRGMNTILLYHLSKLL